MRRRNSEISVRSGSLEFIKLNARRFDWRDSYHWILTLTWPRFALFVFSVYFCLNLLFATFYVLGGTSIAEMPPGSFPDAFFFSVETLATVGYGHMYPNSWYGHCVTTCEIMTGMFGLAVITGLIFVRFARPTARVAFSSVAVVAPFDGVPTIMLRAANLRHHSMAEAEFHVMLLRSEPNLEEGDIRRFHTLQLHFDRMISFPVVLTLRHRIDETSPLYGWTPEMMHEANCILIASVVCLDTMLAAPVQSMQVYERNRILWHYRFTEIYQEQPDGRFTVDYARISDIEKVPGGTPVARNSL